MKTTQIYTLFLSLILSSLLYAQEKPSEEFAIKWHNGFKFDSPDQNFKLKFGGRVQMDWAFFKQDDTLNTLFGKPNNTTEFRRVRFYSAGTVYNNVSYKLQLDFGKGKATFKDVFIEIHKIPFLGSLRAGNFKEPIRLEVQTSSKYLLFMERANTTDFMPERSFGLMVHNSFLKQRGTFAIGTFRTSNAFGNDYGKDDYSVTARITGLPFYNAEKNRLLHVGIAYSYRNPNTDTYKVEAKPESHMAPKYIATGTIGNVKNIGIIGGEMALVWGRFSLQGEYLGTTVQASIDSFPSYRFSSYYGGASVFLTGEHRNYKASAGAFDRISPNKNFDGADGFGAFELTARYSETNLNSTLINGGKLKDVTVGLNWYLNPVSRFMFNYVLANLENTSELGKANIAQVRFQVDF